MERPGGRHRRPIRGLPWKVPIVEMRGTWATVSRLAGRLLFTAFILLERPSSETCIVPHVRRAASTWKAGYREKACRPESSGYIALPPSPHTRTRTRTHIQGASRSQSSPLSRPHLHPPGSHTSLSHRRHCRQLPSHPQPRKNRSSRATIPRRGTCRESRKLWISPPWLHPSPTLSSSAS